MKHSPRRLKKSLEILRSLTRARRKRSTGEVARLEAVLKQHDYDGRDKVDSRQLSIWETQMRYQDTDKVSLEVLQWRRAASCPLGGAHEWNLVGGDLETCVGCGTPSNPITYYRSRRPKTACPHCESKGLLTHLQDSITGRGRVLRCWQCGGEYDRKLQIVWPPQ